MRLINFNKTFFILAAIIFALLTFVTLIAAGAEDEGTIGTNPVWLSLAKLFYVFRFPTHTLLWPLIGLSGPLMPVIFLGGLAANCLFYAFVMERLFSFIKTKPSI